MLNQRRNKTEDSKVELKIIEKDDNFYKLESQAGKKYEFTLNFWDIDEQPNIDDVIYISSNLLESANVGFSLIYDFGDLNSNNGRKNLKTDDEDIVKIIIKEKEIYLKRFYV